MKLLLFITILFSCQMQKTVNTISSRSYEMENFIIQDSTMYQVQEIDSINNYYILYTIKEKNIFKIVSKKDEICEGNCIPIRVGKLYPLKITSVFSNNQNSLLPGGMANLYAWKPDEKTEITLAGIGTYRNLYFAENIKSLCFLEDE